MRWGRGTPIARLLSGSALPEWDGEDRIPLMVRTMPERSTAVKQKIEESATDRNRVKPAAGPLGYHEGCDLPPSIDPSVIFVAGTSIYSIETPPAVRII